MRKPDGTFTLEKKKGVNVRMYVFGFEKDNEFYLKNV